MNKLVSITRKSKGKENSLFSSPRSDMIHSEKDHAQGRVKKFIANSYSTDHWSLSAKLQKFSELLDNEADEEEEDAGLNAARKLLEKVGDIYNNNSSLESLEDFLFSTELNPPIGDQVHQDMKAPLLHYFIHTSLNSYFTGNLIGKYSILPIIDALKQGVRDVELDLWPCGKDGICVRPSWDFEKPLTLQECLDCIKAHAFSTTSYPVIITFKDGLKPDLESKATQMIEQTFGNMLFRDDPHTSSPAQLQNMILISKRPRKGMLYAADDKTGVKVQEEKEESPFRPVEPRGMLRKALTNKAKKIQPPGWYEKHVIRFTKTGFVRTRPKRKLLISSPYKPQRAWMHGAQMIALSRQEDKEKLWLMQGMFRANGGCGYIKKPDFLLNDGSSEFFYSKEDQRPVKTLNVKIYMGDGWLVDFKKSIGRLSKPDLYVRISIVGVPHDEKIMKTREKNNEWTPTWGEEFAFPLNYPDLALLSIQVYDHEVSTADGFGGQTCLPVSELIEGIRAVRLYDEKGEACSSTMLLIRFKWSYPTIC